MKMCSAYHVWTWMLLFIFQMLLWVFADSEPRLISVDQEKLMHTLLVTTTMKTIVSELSIKPLFFY